MIKKALFDQYVCIYYNINFLRADGVVCPVWCYFTVSEGKIIIIAMAHSGVVCDSFYGTNY